MTKKLTTSRGLLILVDDQDFNFLAQFTWTVRISKKLKYAVTAIDGKLVRLHRLLLNPPKHLVVDHINNNGLDNRRKNLRVCTQKHNCRNQNPRIGNLKGVSFCARVNKYRAYIGVNYTQKHLGYFKTKSQAALAYNTAAKKYFGVYAKPNRLR